MRPGTTCSQLAEQAVAGGADVIGMAGGDGSQALVAGVAAASGIGFVCVPAGTRNHLAMDLGLDRGDVAGALDAFGAAVERRIDLGLVGERLELPPSGLVGLTVGVLAAASEPELLIATAAEGLLTFDGRRMLHVRPDRPDQRKLTAMLALDVRTTAARHRPRSGCSSSTDAG